MEDKNFNRKAWILAHCIDAKRWLCFNGFITNSEYDKGFSLQKR